MTINAACLRGLRAATGLPVSSVVSVTVDLVDFNGCHVTKVQIFSDRTVDVNSGKIYSSPSRLRHHLLKAHTATYRYLIFKGTSLEALGVHA